MKALYIHGLHSYPNSEKTAILESFGLEALAPAIDYEKEQGQVYGRIKALALSENIDIIVGSSMGGFIGYWLSQDIAKPALLFNPAVHFDSMQQFIPAIAKPSASAIYVCIGEKDQTVNPQHLRNYLNQQNPSHNNLKIITSSWMEHGIDLQSFKSITAWFLAEIR